MKIARLISVYCKTLLIVSILGVFQEQIKAQCAHMQVISQSQPGSANQCAVGDNGCVVSPPTQYFLQMTTYETESAVMDGTGWSESGSDKFITTQSVDPGDSCAGSSYFTGNCTYNFAYTNSISESGTDDNGNESSSDQAAFGNEYGVFYYLANDVFNPYNTTSTYQGQCFGSGSTTNEMWLASGSDYTAAEKYSQTVTMSGDAINLARSEAIAQIPPFTDQWITNQANSCGSASFSWGGYSEGVSASASTMEYFIHITDCQLHFSYFVTWDQVTTYTNNPIPKVQHKFEVIAGSDDPAKGANGKVHIVSVPGSPCIITESNFHWAYSGLDMLLSIPGY